MKGETARDQLAHLATSLQGAEQNFRGCLSPVRVRLVRADGALLEKQGCRGQNGWSRIASESVNSFITAALTPARAPASENPAEPAKKSQEKLSRKDIENSVNPAAIRAKKEN